MAAAVLRYLCRKNYRMKNQFILLLTSLIFASWASAQNGAVIGAVYDEEGLALPGATVYVEALKRGTVTDVQGKFTLVNIPAGNHVLDISFIGYEGTKQNATVAPGQTAEVSITLKSGYILGEEVVVLGDRLKGQAKALNQQRANTNITNVVAADQIGRFPDANIGDAMKRIPGITVINDQGEARFGLIRGTEPRFNSVTVNGERVPSAENNTRTVQLDLIPADMIQTIEVNKALTPDMDADAIGGSANLVTRAAPRDLRLSGTIGSGYNFLSGMPMGIGSIVIGKRFANNKLGIILGGSYFNHNFGSDNAEFEWDRTTTGVPFLSNHQIRKYDIQRIRRSGSLSLDYRLGANSTIYLRSLYNLRDDWENRFRVVYSGMSAPNADGLTRGRVEVEIKGGGKDQKYRRQERQITTVNTLSGEHLFGNKLKLDWSATYSYAQEDRPNERYISWRSANLPLASGLRPNTANPEYAFVNTAANFDRTTLPFRRFQLRNDFTDEQDLNGRFNLQLPLNENNRSVLKFGGVVRTKAKDVQRRRGLLVPAQGQVVRFTDFDTKDYSDDDFLANGGSTTYRVGVFPLPQVLEGFEQRYNATFQADDVANKQASFNGKETILGGYAMLTQSFGERLIAIVGARVENTRVTYNGTQFDQVNNESKVSGDNSYTNFLPALHLKYDLSRRTILRAAWTNTLARPDYADLSPGRVVDLSENTLFSGNPTLKPTRSMNFDFMLEHYFPSVGIVSAGAFYKNINDFIYATSIQNYLDPISGNTFQRATTPLNGPSATLLGAEAAFQRQLDFLPGFLRHLGIYLNYTFSNSDAEVLFFNEGEGKSISFNTTLPGTAKHNFNGSLAYETKRFQVRVSLNYHSGLLDPDDTFLALATAKTSDRRYLDAQSHLDANASFAITPKWRLFVEANNLTNQPLRYYQELRERTMQAEYYNVRIQAGLKLDFFKSYE